MALRNVLIACFAFVMLCVCVCVSITTSKESIVINEVELNPYGNDLHSDVYEWVELYNPTEDDIDLSGWTLSTTHGKTVTVYLSGVIKSHGYYVYKRGKQWLDNEDESVVLKDPYGFEIDRTPKLSDDDNDAYTWQRCDDSWIFAYETEGAENNCPTPSPSPSPSPSPTPSPTPTPTPTCYPPPSPNPYVWKEHLNTTKFGESGIVSAVIDGDTIDVSGIGRVRLADIDTPEKWEEGYEEAKEFVENLTLGKKVYLDIDDFCITGKYGRIIAVVYAPYGNECFVNLNQMLLKEGYAEISDYYNEFSPYDWVYEPLEVLCQFDFEPPEKPYPSIAGTFIGEIIPNKTIIATKLYTYACEGTGGHTEYALIWNETWCAEASWKGYEDDWMNISFNKTVILMPYETYNIMMKTGSYPQIHHTNELETDVGKIRCVEFVDVNGRRYKDWIPAFKLYE